MGKTAQKLHDKKKFETGVIGPDGTFYKTGQQGEVELRLCYNLKGKKIGMHWCHKTKGFKWRKGYADEIRKEIKKK